MTKKKSSSSIINHAIETKIKIVYLSNHPEYRDDFIKIAEEKINDLLAKGWYIHETYPIGEAGGNSGSIGGFIIFKLIKEHE